MAEETNARQLLVFSLGEDAGLAHVMLPTGGPGETPGRFAPSAVPVLVEELERLGAVIAEATGGSTGRTVRLLVEEPRAVVKEAGAGERELLRAGVAGSLAAR